MKVFLKKESFQNSSKIATYFGYFCKNFRHQDLSKISQTDHTDIKMQLALVWSKLFSSAQKKFFQYWQQEESGTVTDSGASRRAPSRISSITSPRVPAGPKFSGSTTISTLPRPTRKSSVATSQTYSVSSRSTTPDTPRKIPGMGCCQRFSLQPVFISFWVAEPKGVIIVPTHGTIRYYIKVLKVLY